MPNLPKILLIDDDPIVHTVVDGCLGPLIDFYGADSRASTLKIVEENKYELVIVDLKLGDGNGFDLIRELRNHPNTRGAIFCVITSEEGVREEIEGHKLGVHEYIKKPVEPELLRAIIEKNIKRQFEKTETLIKKGDLIIDLGRVKVSYLDEDIELTNKEFKLLLKLAENEGQVFSRDRLMQSIWSEESESLIRTVDMHISSLRKKLKGAGKYIQTVRSMGYIFELS